MGEVEPSHSRIRSANSRPKMQVRRAQLDFISGSDFDKALSLLRSIGLPSREAGVNTNQTSSFLSFASLQTGMGGSSRPQSRQSQGSLEGHTQYVSTANHSVRPNSRPLNLHGTNQDEFNKPVVPRSGRHSLHEGRSNSTVSGNPAVALMRPLPSFEATPLGPTHFSQAAWQAPHPSVADAWAQPNIFGGAGFRPTSAPQAYAERTMVNAYPFEHTAPAMSQLPSLTVTTPLQTQASDMPPSASQQDSFGTVQLGPPAKKQKRSRAKPVEVDSSKVKARKRASAPAAPRSKVRTTQPSVTRHRLEIEPLRTEALQATLAGRPTAMGVPPPLAVAMQPALQMASSHLPTAVGTPGPHPGDKAMDEVGASILELSSQTSPGNEASTIPHSTLPPLDSTRGGAAETLRPEAMTNTVSAAANTKPRTDSLVRDIEATVPISNPTITKAAGKRPASALAEPTTSEQHRPVHDDTSTNGHGSTNDASTNTIPQTGNPDLCPFANPTRAADLETYVRSWRFPSPPVIKSPKTERREWAIKSKEERDKILDERMRDYYEDEDYQILLADEQDAFERNKFLWDR